jgi:hypothetical protein
MQLHFACSNCSDCSSSSVPCISRAPIFNGSYVKCGRSLAAYLITAQRRVALPIWIYASPFDWNL